MSKKEDFDVLEEIVAQATNRIISTSDLLHKAETQEMPFEFVDLLNYWKQGKLYASEVRLSNSGYLPIDNCLWTTHYHQGFFGYDKSLGAYQASEEMPNPMFAFLEATIPTNSPALCIAMHPNRNLFAIGTLSGVILLCDLSLGAIVGSLHGSRSRAWTLAYDPLGQFLLSGHQDGSLCKWDMAGNLERKVQTNDWVRSITLTSDGKRFLTSHRGKTPEDRSIYHWDLESFEHMESFAHVSGNVWSIRYLIDGEGFISAGNDKKVTLWSFPEQRTAWSEKKHTGTVVSLAMHPYGGIVASGAWTGSIKLWDIKTGEDVRTIEAHAARTYGLAFSPSGNLLASGGKDSQICLWQMPSGGILSQFIGHSGWVRGVHFANEGTLISVGSEGTCKIWGLRYRLPIPVELHAYHSPEEVLHDFRRAIDNVDE